mmetsp:Transcript_17766/g.35475  ORF Transcript_17766/g.35475 Transcript_17766/m.35475 type:complete len:299 (+) Transcript_17766:277-1173(+)
MHNPLLWLEGQGVRSNALQRKRAPGATVLSTGQLRKTTALFVKLDHWTLTLEARSEHAGICHGDGDGRNGLLCPVLCPLRHVRHRRKAAHRLQRKILRFGRINLIVQGHDAVHAQACHGNESHRHGKTTSKHQRVVDSVCQNIELFCVVCHPHVLHECRPNPGQPHLQLGRECLPATGHFGRFDHNTHHLLLVRHPGHALVPAERHVKQRAPQLANRPDGQIAFHGHVDGSRRQYLVLESLGQPGLGLQLGKPLSEEIAIHLVVNAATIHKNGTGAGKHGAVETKQTKIVPTHRFTAL